MKKETDSSDPDDQERCASCGARLKGDYCRKCGEKKIVPERDFSLRKFFRQTLGHFAHFDSKLLQSAWLLLSQPGFLSAEWIAGRRVNYIKPLQLFLVAGLLFYFFLPTTTAYFTSYRELDAGYREGNSVMNTFHYDAAGAMAEKATKGQTDEAMLQQQIIATAAQKSKTWLFLIIPFWGALIYPFFRNKMPWLVPQLIFALHGLSFYILSDLALHALFYVLDVPNLGEYLLPSLLIIFSGYQLLAIRRVYGDAWLTSFFKTMGVMAVFIVLILLYRQLMTIWTIAIL